jgi:hypothetical protein
MDNGKFISSKAIIDKAFRDHPFITDHLELERTLEWIGDIIGLMGVNSMLIDKCCTLTVEDYKAKLPSDLVHIQLTRYSNGKEMQAMRYDGDPFGCKMHCEDSQNLCCSTDKTYKLNNDFMFTSFEEGDVDLAYKAFPIDEEGFPLVPDNPSAIEAITWHIAYKIAYIMWVQDLMKGDKFKFIKQQKDWYVGQAIGVGKMLSIDQAETWKNMTLRLIPVINAHSDGFKNIGNQEMIWRHNTNNFNQADRTY